MIETGFRVLVIAAACGAGAATYLVNRWLHGEEQETMDCQNCGSLNTTESACVVGGVELIDRECLDCGHRWTTCGDATIVDDDCEPLQMVECGRAW